MAKKKISAEERKEYKNGKYTGGPAEEKAEKKSKGKRMFLGGNAISAGTGRYPGTGDKMGRAQGRGADIMGNMGDMPGQRIGQRRQPSGIANAQPMPLPSPGGPLPTGPSRPMPRGIGGLEGTPQTLPGVIGGGLGRPNGIGGAGSPGASGALRAKDYSNGLPETSVGMKRGGKVGRTFKKGGKVDGMGKNKDKGRNLGLGLNPIPPLSTHTNGGFGLRGGGLARKGVGQALSKGGSVKGCGCAKRGTKKPSYK